MFYTYRACSFRIATTLNSPYYKYNRNRKSTIFSGNDTLRYGERLVLASARCPNKAQNEPRVLHIRDFLAVNTCKSFLCRSCMCKKKRQNS